ncbi:prephenate dehydrogenase [Paenibacillus sp. N1-5-1-14]|uniref:prephenate dehydrogenase n=1 Tax=Paenibacillus radicibacter TaxID=2972488 RepID=UPI002159A766|nr:prephenate dehydrogenase [Paenibacillus radicibacter]MCR8642277.1 prephenate dehydrogenase [Paenibacillus radicibacter]
MTKTRIAIFGVGLIGGSLALCLKGKPGYTIVGHSPSQKSVDKMLQMQVVDEATTSMVEAVVDADVIVLCVPVSLLDTYLEELATLPLKEGCILTDVGSTKGSIAACASRLNLKHVHFIGGHPMAGSERSGIEAASSHLFENAFYVLCPSEGTPQPAIDRLTDLLYWTKAQIIQVNPQEHDEIVGAISHLPHIIAVALVNQVCDYNDSNSLYKLLAAGGFRDITRIASSEPTIWRDILINNRDILLKLLGDWNTKVDEFIQLLENEDAEGIASQFQKANDFRRSVPDRRKGMLPSQYDIYVDIPDQPGIIGAIATQLGQQQINLSNLHIFESRDYVPGILRLSFRKQDDADRAAQLLHEQFAIHV